MTESLYIYKLAIQEGIAGTLLLICFICVLGLCLLDLIILKMERTYETDTDTDAKRVRPAGTIQRDATSDLPEQLVRANKAWGWRIQSDENK